MNNQPIVWSPGVTLKEIEKQVIHAAYRYFKQNKTQTAQALGISIRTLDNKFSEYKTEEGKQEDAEAKRTESREEFARRARAYHGDPTPDELAKRRADQRARNEALGISEGNRGPAKAIQETQDFSDGFTTEAGVPVEPAAQLSQEQPLPVSERQEVQAMPSKSSPGRSNGKRS